MILSKNSPTLTSSFLPGQRVAYITGGGRSFRLATVVSSNDNVSTNGKQTRVTIRLDATGKEVRVQPWNLKTLEGEKLA